MMAIEPRRLRAIESVKLLELGRHDVFEGADKSGVKNNLVHAPSEQVGCNFLLPSYKPGGASRRRKRCCEIQMKSGIDSSLASDGCRSLRILHEDHRARRRHGSANQTFKYPLRSLMISSPIVGVYDEPTRLRYLCNFLVRFVGQAWMFGMVHGRRDSDLADCRPTPFMHALHGATKFEET